MLNTAQAAYKESLTCHLLKAAKSVTPLHWKSISSPSIEEGLAELAHTHRLEELIAHPPEEVDRVNKT